MWYILYFMIGLINIKHHCGLINNYFMFSYNPTYFYNNIFILSLIDCLKIFDRFNTIVLFIS